MFVPRLVHVVFQASIPSRICNPWTKMMVRSLWLFLIEPLFNHSTSSWKGTYHPATYKDFWDQYLSWNTPGRKNPAKSCTENQMWFGEKATRQFLLHQYQQISRFSLVRMEAWKVAKLSWRLIYWIEKRLIQCFRWKMSFKIEIVHCKISAKRHQVRCLYAEHVIPLLSHMLWQVLWRMRGTSQWRKVTGTH